MKIIIGLGNIGEKYKNTRHNAGFLAVDIFAKSIETPEQNIEWKEDKKYIEKKVLHILIL